jgi:hypothetical protein
MLGGYLCGSAGGWEEEQIQTLFRAITDIQPRRSFEDASNERTRNGIILIVAGLIQAIFAAILVTGAKQVS